MSFVFCKPAGLLEARLKYLVRRRGIWYLIILSFVPFVLNSKKKDQSTSDWVEVYQAIKLKFHNWMSFRSSLCSQSFARELKTSEDKLECLSEASLLTSFQEESLSWLS